MFAEEWPLMMFTMFAQLAMGTFIILMIAGALIGRTDSRSADRLTKFGFTAVGPLMLIALILSVFHLGDPLGAYRALFNVGSSWLSREIWTSSIFFGLWFLFWLTVRRNKPNHMLGWLTALVGVIAIFSMGGAYSSSMRIAWANVNTFIVFWGTALAMGTLGALSCIALSARHTEVSDRERVRRVLKNMSFVGVAAVVLPLLYLPVFLSGLDTTTAAVASAQVITGNAGLVVIRYILSLAGTVMLAVLLLRQAKKSGNLSVNIVLLALVMVIAGEFIGRYIFYSYGISPIIG